MRRKITVVGAGNVGATCAQRLAERDYADVVLVDSDSDDPASLALDLNIASAMRHYAPTVVGSNDFIDMSGSAIVVLTTPADGVAAAAAEVRDRAPDSTMVVVADPVEPMCHAAYDVTVFARERVVGVASNVHSAAFRLALARELRVSVRDISAVVLGGHGNVVPVLSCATVAGMPIRRRIPEERLEQIAQGIRDSRDALTLSGETSLSSAASAAVLDVVDAIVRDQRRVLPCAALCKGEYGFEEVFVGLPVKLGAGGIDEIVEMDLDDDERRGLAESARAVEEALAQLKAG